MAVACVVGLSMTVASPADAVMPDSPPADEIVIDVVNANGSGCPAGTTEIVVAPDNKAFTVTYSEYAAVIDPNDPTVPATAFRKNCQLMLDVHVPQGFTYAIAKADYRGYVSLPRGATATQKASYYFQGDSSTVRLTHEFRGPLDDNWQTTDETDVAAMVYAPCGAKRYFAINTELRVNKGTSNPRVTPSMIFMDSTDGSISTEYHFHWLRCPR